ncbi:sulfite exporter TauE/SafE family protein [Ancylobacter sp. 6x-1]|uniref:Probable membrane transporter protein n=1 Tax=Ancylobacter crimeensis TaxID=2579147 RepID=A0ABT0DAT8_9HYPH|nr:sulfite exporter TauE/SafE family protein [Ancylobacter crimeensis]MCK0197069.1 sulfite exporter TauE/SafE family protein [Ancylobacter crimeensis]
MDPSVTFWLAALAAAFAVGMGKGGVPMIGTLSVPIMSLVMHPIPAAGLLLPVYVVSDLFGVIAYRREFSARNVAIFVPSAAIGILIGWASASVVSEAAVMVMVGSIGLAFCLVRWFGASREARPADVPRGMFWGTVSGFTSFVTHGGAPPFQMYVVPQRLPKMVYAGTSTLTFAAINWMKVPAYWALGELNLANLETAALLLPVAIAATYVGVWATRRIPDGLFYRLIMAALFLLSLKILHDGVIGLLS